MEISVKDLLPYSTFKTSRSGGKGGQNVNKVSSKVELNFGLEGASIFTEEQKDLIREKLANRILSGDRIQVICEEERSQYLNKERCLEKLSLLIKHALHVQKPRKATKPKRSAIENRLKAKQLQAMKKLARRKDYY
jgi:ribosome-associated protein